MLIYASMKYFFNIGKNRPGNIMLLALLMLAGGIVSGIVISVLVVSEVRQAYTLDSSLLAYYTAEGGLEEKLYDIRIKEACTGANVCDDADYVDCDADASCKVKVNPAAHITTPLIKEDETFQIDLRPGDDIGKLAIQWYKKNVEPSLSVSFINLPSTNNLYVCRPDDGVPIPCNDTADNKCTDIEFESENFSDGCSANLFAYSAGETQQMRLKAFNDDILQLQITPSTFGINNCNGGDCVFSYYLDVASRGDSGRVRYEVKTVVPSQVPAYGFPDYVIFSQQEIVK